MDRQAGPADSRVERVPEQQHLDPAHQPGRESQSCGSPHAGNPEPSRQRNREQIAHHGSQQHADEGIPKRCPRVAERVIRRRVQAAERRRKQPDRCACEDGPDVRRVLRPESARLKQRRGDDVAKSKKRDGRRDHKESDLTQARFQTASQLVGGRRIDVGGR